VIAVINWLITSEAQGVFNVTAPDAVTNARFSQLLADALHRPCLFPQPAAIVQLMFGEMGEQLLLNGQNVIPARLLAEGFVFRYPGLQDALVASISGQ
jgi:NAD dependent epimerase/dehydratase family enzyme